MLGSGASGFEGFACAQGFGSRCLEPQPQSPEVRNEDRDSDAIAYTP